MGLNLAEATIMLCFAELLLLTANKTVPIYNTASSPAFTISS